MAKSKKISDENQTDEKQVEFKATEQSPIVKPGPEDLPAPVEDPVEAVDPVILDACVTLGGEASYSFGDESLSKMEQKELAAVLINELKKI